MTAYRKALSCLAALCMALCLAACGMPQENAGNDEAAATLPAEGAVEVSKDTRYIHPLFDDVLVEKDIPYGSAVDYTGQTQTLLLDVYTPEGDTETKRPAIIWVHGGGFTSGSKDTGIERILAEAFARKGYVCLSIDYRLRDDTSDWYGTLSDTVADAYTAVKWAIAHSGEYGIDPDHIALGGHSAGGNIVTGLYNDAVPEDALEPVFGIINMAGGSYGLGAIKGPAPPCLILHGTQDDIVPYMGAADCMERLSQAGIEATFYTLDEGTHDLYPFATEVEDVITRFLYDALTGIAVDIPIRKGVAVRYREEYRAGQIDLTIDGDLSEWKGAESIPLDQLKEAGSALPDPQDCTGSAMIGWHAEDPARVYFACTVTDDTLCREPGVPLYEADTMEVYLNLTPEDSSPQIPLLYWIFGPDSQECMTNGAADSIEWAVRVDGNTYIYEGAIDVTRTGKDGPAQARDFRAVAGGSVGLSIAYNDCENGEREHQIGWIGGPIQFPQNFGRLVFE